MASAPWAVWGTLALLVAAVLGGGVYAGLAGLGAWRDFKRTSRVLGAGGDALTERADEVTRKADGAAQAGARIAESAARLQRSLAYARVVADAAGDVRAALTRLRGVAPRK